MLALTTLLKEALSIEHDLAARLSQRPKQKSLLKQHRDYRQLVEHLSWELERTLATYLAILKAANGAAGPVIEPSRRASNSPMPEKRRARAR
jgi:hypothetical protein